MRSFEVMYQNVYVLYMQVLYYRKRYKHRKKFSEIIMIIITKLKIETFMQWEINH